MGLSGSSCLGTYFLMTLAPIDPVRRLERIFSLAHEFVVEVETHPVHPEEYRFLTGGEISRRAVDVRIVPPSSVPRRGRPWKGGDP